MFGFIEMLRKVVYSKTLKIYDLKIVRSESFSIGASESRLPAGTVVP